jgi:predicted transcriptional regulator
MKRRTRTISPRLASGDSRLIISHRLPDEVKEGLRSIADYENKSMGWVLEQCILDYFNLKRPKYKKGKASEAK